MASVKDGVRFIGGVMEMTGVAKSLVSAGQWGEALDMIEELDRLWHLEKEDAKPTRPPPVPAKSGRSSPLPTVMESPPATPAPPPPPPPAPSITSLLTQSLRRPTGPSPCIDHGDHVLALVRIREPLATGPRRANRREPGRLARVSPSGVRHVFERQAKTAAAITGANESTVKRRIPALELGEDDAISPQSSAVAELRAMSHSSFMDLIRSMYRGLLNCVEGLHRENVIVVEVVQSIQYVRARFPGCLSSSPFLGLPKPSST
ncbi:hypothetical protein NUW54_g13332 [Trametes sanguinea]|uniref:Uncharacterized protein n=1 Tax=Trametes sanguinea TaxID=158606 RepID=A0ACC1MPA1_9APHY|nr:hypothetical protein NUW54_g13332 [Trametes sanguinea]